MEKQKEEIVFKNLALGAVVIIWTIGSLVDIFSSNFKVPQELYFLVAIIVGYLTGTSKNAVEKIKKTIDVLTNKEGSDETS